MFHGMDYLRVVEHCMHVCKSLPEKPEHVLYYILRHNWNYNYSTRKTYNFKYIQGAQTNSTLSYVKQTMFHRMDDLHVVEH